MRRSRDDLHSFFARKRRNDAAKLRNIFARFLDVGADARADLDHRLDHLGLDLFAQKQLAFVQYLRNVRFQLARFGSTI
jgi:hypothetical protein